MRSVDSNVLNALKKGALKARNFIWITGQDSSGDTYSLGFWDDVGTVTVSYQDVNDGTIKTRDYVGAGTLLTVDDIPLTNDATVRNVNCTLSQIDTTVTNLVRGYNLRNAPVEIHRGIFKVGTEQLITAAEPRFVGFISTLVITDPQEGNDGSIQVTLVSHTRELTRTNTDVCSDSSQKLRSSTDSFYKDMATVGQWQVWWGSKRGTIQSNQAPPPNTKTYIDVEAKG